MEKKKEATVIDLFCGIGGLSYGFVAEGFNVIAGYDNDPTCKFAFESNNKATFYTKDITELEGSELDVLYGDNLKILVGCAPCQPFSSYSFKVKEKDEKKMNMLYTFSRLVEEVEPTIVSMENVPQLADIKKNTIFKDFCEKLQSLGYHVHYEVVYCPDYGIPQTRKRLVLLASKLGDIKLLPKTHNSENYVTVRETIANLPAVNAGEFDPNDPLHRARALSPLNMKRIQNTKEGGSWKDWPEELLLECYKKKSGRTYGSVYGRMKWNAPSPTMTTHCTGLGNGRFGHPEQNRAITLREASLLQTFPMEYKFYENIDNYNPSIISRQIGNAVPPKLGQIIAESIKNHLIDNKILDYGKEKTS
ncbi:modification methylase [Porphyromonas gulae]|uniref:DNA cytosine methyltransferase n=1 Tax=Bacteroidales TaxID=171549 RepID=UPI0003DC2FE4|nr:MULTISPECIES: DNA (cytosine-5-)-methyltransferase [Bacteroidales]KGN69845.1 modification methylase [Porphyromonas gulae]MBB3894379.1 DNA (cytosine-5)-methyltransferase 1 [Bacteroides pyogenes]GAE21263.1 DNA-cytosine methyltransferase [Bacteroides pyogenes JCM 10003]SUV35547.1 DNA-cytosine methyltransferase [Bacteroides pyogenes]